MEKEPETYDVCIIGGGLWGSAASRYVSEHPDLRVCLVGPTEPKPEDFQTADVLGSHYDEGRIACQIEQPGTIWPLLTHRSIRNFRHLENLSGIKFFSEVGCLISRGETSEYQHEVESMSNEFDLSIEKCSRERLQQLFPALLTYPQRSYWYMKKDSGYISPRLIIKAQQKVAKSQGCNIIHDTAIDVERTKDVGRKSLRIQTRNGNIIHANRVLLCTGAFTNFHGILPDSLKLHLTPESELVVKVEVDPTTAQKDFKNMPPILCENGLTLDLCDYYFLPPIKYPNGKYYMKLGHGEDFVRPLKTMEEIKSWFCNKGDKWLGEVLIKLLQTVTDFKGTNVEFDSSVTTHTPTEYPFCGMLNPNIGVLVGGNGTGAGCSDEIGRMGARMIVKGEWDYDLPEELFKPTFKP